MNPQDEPNALEDTDEQKRRKDLLDKPHMKPLKEYAAAIRAARPEAKVPDFDPCDGGTRACALFLLEAPGPKAVSSGFISRNNPDPTANNFCRLLQEAGIARADTAIWNIVPWYVGNEGGTHIRAVSKNDLEEARPYLQDLLTLLPHLQVIVLVGKKALSAKREIQELTSRPIKDTPHPSARVFRFWPHKEDEMRAELRRVAAIIDAAGA